MLPLTTAAAIGSFLPASTPVNAVAYRHHYFSNGDLVKTGAWFLFLALPVHLALMNFWGVMILGIDGKNCFCGNIPPGNGVEYCLGRELTCP
jgi:hypothetical protein